MTTVVLALAASAIIGLSDYLGGRAGERTHPMVVAFAAQGTYLFVAPPLALLLGATEVTTADIAWGLAAGALSGVAYLFFFTALASGRMGVAAPITAAVGAALPVAVDLLTGIELRPGRWIGLALALVAVPVVAAPSAPEPGQAQRSVGAVAALAAIAGVLFAGFFLCMGETSPDSGQWPFVASAVTATSTIGVACVLVGVRLGRRGEERRWLGGRRPGRLAFASGATGAVAGTCITAALQRGPVAVASVLGSLYPIVTVALAARFSDERVRWWHVAGLCLAVAGAGLVAVYR